MTTKSNAADTNESSTPDEALEVFGPERCLGCHAKTDLDDDGYCADCSDEYAEDNGE